MLISEQLSNFEIHYLLIGNNRVDRYTLFQVFRQVAEQGSFAAAGRQLGLSAPTISKSVAELEAHLSVRLIHRTTRRMSLTEEGKIYLEHLVRGLDALIEAEEMIFNAKASPHGVLKVSAPMTTTLIYLSEAIPDFLSAYPDLKLEMHLDDRRVDLVQEGFDLAIRGYGQLDDSRLVARKLTVMPLVLCATPNFFEIHGIPQTPMDLRGLEHIRFPYGHQADVWTFRKNDQVEEVSVKARYSVTSSLAVRDALRAGFGVSLIPRPYVQQDLQTGVLQEVLQDWSTTEVTQYAIYPSRQHLAPKIRVFIDFLVEQFKEMDNL